MADFVAVLRKTIDGLGDTTPEMRARVYEKARTTVAAKLAALNPAPPTAVAERQKKTLEDAIAEIEASFAPPRPRAADPSDPLAELENVFASLKAKPASIPPLSSGTAPNYSEPKPWPVTTPKPAADTAKADTPPVARQEPPRKQADDFDMAGVPPADHRDFHPEDETDDDLEEAPRRRRGFGGVIAAAIALAVLAGGGYAVWLNKQDFADMLGIGGEEVAATSPVEPTGAPSTGTLPPPVETPSGTASHQPAVEPEAPKFTQRLNADGSEIDVGPAGGEPGVGEGTSVAAVTTPPVAAPAPAAVPPAAATPADQTAAATPPPAGEPPADQATAATDETQKATPAPDGTTPAPDATQPAAPAGAAATEPTPTPPAVQVAVGQKAIFYEERTSTAQGSAEAGTVVWSIVQESPGGDLPPEPAIRGEATIPGKDLQLRMTIRRNADQTLPASHIIELIFLTPDNFEGGGIDNILRFALKGTEEAAGSPLIGIPAKIADGFFLVALNDSKAEIDANMTLLRRESWIDVPVIYKNQRRALITMEKGIPGDKVFDEALKAWQTASAG